MCTICFGRFILFYEKVKPLRTLTMRERGEIESCEFYGEETWLKWKKHYGELMSYRKSLKGKPTEE